MTIQEQKLTKETALKFRALGRFKVAPVELISVQALINRNYRSGHSKNWQVKKT